MRVKSTSLASLLAATFLILAGCASHPVSEPAAVPADTGARIAAAAKTMLGQPYRYGGAAPGGFDCSGLVHFAARSAGLALPRTAKEQLGAGVRVDRPELAPGDLVFMRLARKELHVGIAIGGGRFIHAPAAGGRVRIDSLAAEPYSAGFIDARRVIPTRPPPGF